ncbi:MAG TPA: GAF domain-containing protein [Cytophagaceae bacterium]|jgi:light-regulated signal transduction histidine kinase (bacteriophytochrome)
MNKDSISLAEKIKRNDEEVCGRLPLNYTNAIQPFGAILCLDKNGTVIQLSDNIDKLFSRSIEDILNKSLREICTQDSFDNFEAALLENQAYAVLRLADNDDKNYLATMHQLEKYTILEVEDLQAPVELEGLINAPQINRMVQQLLQSVTLDDLFENAVKTLQQFTGFDRVMLYKFDEAWNGTVVGEEKISSLPPYLGLRFPASDIPAQARAMYFNNPYRLIPDVNYKSSKLYPLLNPAINSFTDLSSCNLRSVPGVHVEYLNNMGVRGSMSTPIILDNRLWGLISCHHGEPISLNFTKRSTALLISKVISSRLHSLENEGRYTFSNAILKVQMALTIGLVKNHGLFEVLDSQSLEIMRLVNADGFIVSHNGTLKKYGETIKLEDARKIFYWVNNLDSLDLYFTNSLKELNEEALGFKDLACGVLFVQIGDNPLNYILFTRKEIIQTILWGGNPNDALTFEPNGVTYHPRNSFIEWKETVEYTSFLWSDFDVLAAREIQDTVRSNIN